MNCYYKIRTMNLHGFGFQPLFFYFSYVYNILPLIRMNNSNELFNHKAINCYENDNEFVIQLLLPTRNLNQYLRIIKKTSQISIVKTIDKSTYKLKEYSAFLGISLIEDEKFIVMCEECKRASALEGMEVYEIASLAFISYSQQSKLKQKNNIKKISERIRDYSVLFKDGFYFSHQYNPTLTYPNQKTQETALRFAWNRKFLEQLDTYKTNSNWKCPVIQGYVSSFDVFHLGVKIKYVLISRRSTQKGGTRYFDRGVNDEGFVANFCQTQQIVKIDEFTFSDLQIRGSLPIFFQQVGLYTKTKVNRSFELTHEAYTKHKAKLLNKYKRVFMVNLLCMSKRGQKMLTEQIQSHLKYENEPLFRYLYYDFHHKVKGNDFNKVDDMINELRKMKVNLGYYVYNEKKEKVMSQQMGVFRTNCLDCLDRTNFFQAKLALITLQNIFKQLNISKSNLLDEMKGDKDNLFIRKFRHIWADNGDAISYHYTGTGSTHTDITRDGKRGWLGTFKHKYKSVTRFYNQNFWDFYKMKIVSSLFGNKQFLSKSDINDQLNEREKEYKSVDKIDVYIVTWKAPKIVPKFVFDFPKDAGILVVSIQDLNQQNRWIQRIEQSINKQLYILVQSQTVYHNMVRIYARHELKSRITSVEQGKIKFKSYYNTFVSNKSANIIRFSVDNSKMVFVGCQLEKGREYVQNRIKNIKDIHEYAFQVEEVGVKKTQTIFFDDCIFLIGNMNTNISSNFKNQFAFLSKLKRVEQNADSIIQKMLATDQFSHIRLNLFQCRNYEQAPIHFLPTYKFVNGSFDPDCSGWPDRIWYSSEGKITYTEYGAIEQLRQQHVPVVGRYTVEVYKINKEKQQKIVKQIIEGNESRGEVGVGELQEEDLTQNIIL